MEIGRQAQYRSFGAMGTQCELVLCLVEEGRAEELFSRVEAEVQRLEEKLSPFRPSSELSHINRAAGAQAVPVDEEMLRLFRLCSAYRERTCGCFDITARPGRRSAPDGSPWAVQIDLRHGSIRLVEEGATCDLGGFAKGYALLRAVGILRGAGVSCALLSFGGSAVYGLGSHPHGDCWPVTVSHPRRPLESLWSHRLRDTSLSSSGTRHGRGPGAPHLVRPWSGEPVEGDRILSVHCDDPLDGEVLSTALSVAEPAQRRHILARFDVLDAVEHDLEPEPPRTCVLLKRRPSQTVRGTARRLIQGVAEAEVQR